MGAYAFVLLSLIGLGFRSKYLDKHDPNLAKQLTKQKAEEADYMHKPFEPELSSFGSPLKDLILFRAPRTGSTLAVPFGVLQMAKGDAIALVRARIAQNEEEFLRGTVDYRDD